MDKENELILSGIGACPYCGQAVAVDRREGETPADAAARTCDCIGARSARERTKRIEDSRDLIYEIFGEGCREDELEPVGHEIADMLLSAALLIIDGKISKATVDVPRICKATIKADGKGRVRATRSQSRTIERTEGH